ncbi:hypothetical protein LTR53_012805 [Teratosphaeriaceae sp. CCFEE 6253]|nr:hypothetical protein LTR53_012805 [Teratosphaeriaceae sp. CCFEE 6253]
MDDAHNGPAAQAVAQRHVGDVDSITAKALQQLASTREQLATSRGRLAVRDKTYHCYLFDLPTELRTQMYEYLLSADHIQLHMDDGPSIIGLSTDEIDRTRAYHSSSRRLMPMHHTIILRTCSQVHTEAQGILDQPRGLRLVPSCWAGIFRERRLTEHTCLCHGSNLRHIRSLQLLNMLVTVGSGTNMTETVAQLRYFAGKLSNLCRIEGFLLEIKSPWDNLNDEPVKSLLPCVTSMFKVWARRGQEPRVQIEVRPEDHWDSVTWRRSSGGDWSQCLPHILDPRSESSGWSKTPSRISRTVEVDWVSESHGGLRWRTGIGKNGTVLKRAGLPYGIEYFIASECPPQALTENDDGYVTATLTHGLRGNSQQLQLLRAGPAADFDLYIRSHVCRCVVTSIAQRSA